VLEGTKKKEENKLKPPVIPKLAIALVAAAAQVAFLL